MERKIDGDFLKNNVGLGNRKEGTWEEGIKGFGNRIGWKGGEM